PPRRAAARTAAAAARLRCAAPGPRSSSLLRVAPGAGDSAPPGATGVGGALRAGAVEGLSPDVQALEERVLALASGLSRGFEAMLQVAVGVAADTRVLVAGLDHRQLGMLEQQGGVGQQGAQRRARRDAHAPGGEELEREVERVVQPVGL